jgi:hypothetical protein
MPLTLHYAARKTSSHFQTAGLLTFDAPAAETLQVQVLLFYEGKHTSMEGKATTYNADKIRAIAAATNAWIAGGRRVKVYASTADHFISQGSTIGFLVGNVTAEEITADRLPMPGLDDLVGKIGIYGTIQISGEENVQQYRDGRLKELSVGITPNNEIVEISAVSIPSLAGAAMFSVGNLPSPKEAIAHFHATLAYALTLADQLQEDAIERAQMQLWDLFHAFMDTLFDIREAADENPDLLNGQTPEQLRAKAVEDFITQLRNRLQVTAPTSEPQPLPTVPLFGKTPMPTEETNPEIQRMTARIETLEAADKAKDQQLALFARRETLTDRFGNLRQKAIALRSAGKLTPASFDEKFKDKAVPAVAHYAVGQLDEAEKEIAEFERDCDRLEYLLNELEKNGTAVKFGMPVDGEDLTTQDEAVKKADEFMETYTPQRSY